jgi:hypothetical protein
VRHHGDLKAGRWKGRVAFESAEEREKIMMRFSGIAIACVGRIEEVSKRRGGGGWSGGTTGTAKIGRSITLDTEIEGVVDGGCMGMLKIVASRSTQMKSMMSKIGNSGKGKAWMV